MSIGLHTVLAVHIYFCTSICWGRLQQSAASSRVMLPQQDLLVVYELGTLCIDEFSSKMFVLQQVQEVQTHRVLQVLRIVWFLPIQKILQIIDEGTVFEVAPLGQN